MSCDEALALAPILPTGALEPEELAELEAHLLGCGSCRARSDAFARAVRPLAAADRDPVPPGVWAGIAAGIAATPPGEKPAAATPAEAAPPPVLSIALGCTFCHDALRRDEAAYCASCLAPHHRECFSSHGRCSAPGCGETHVVRAERAPRPVRRWRVTALAACLLGAVSVAAWSVVAQHRLRREAEDQAARARAEADVARGQVQRLLELAREREAQKDYLGAIVDYSKALEIDPSHKGVWWNRGRAQAVLGNLAQAQRDFERALALDPRDAQSHVSLARLLLGQGQYDQARSSALAALALTTDAPLRSEANLVLTNLLRAAEPPRSPPVEPVAEARTIQAELAQVHSGSYAWIDAGQAKGVRKGDVFAVWRAGKVIARVSIEEVRADEAGGLLERVMDQPTPLPGDPAVLANDETVWARTRREERGRFTIAETEERIRSAAGGSLLRVLYVEGYPRWEYRYLKNALVRSKALAARVFLCSADPEFTQEASPGLPALTTLPLDYSDVDVLVVGDLHAEQLHRPAVDALLARGGGLVLLAGDEQLAPPGLLELSPATPLLALQGSQEFALDGLSVLPGLLKTWYEPVLPPLHGLFAGGLASGGRALIADGAGRPVLSIREVGPGRVLQVGAGDTWRWRQERGDPPHAAFWLETLGIAGGRLEERRDPPQRPARKPGGAAEATQRALAERLQDGLTLLDEESYAEALKRFREVLDDPAAMPSDLERIRTKVADLARRRRHVAEAKSVLANGRDEDLLRIDPMLQLLEAWLPADHASLADVKELRRQVTERLQALRAAGSAKGVCVMSGQRLPMDQLTKFRDPKTGLIHTVELSRRGELIELLAKGHEPPFGPNGR